MGAQGRLKHRHANSPFGASAPKMKFAVSVIALFASVANAGEPARALLNSRSMLEGEDPCTTACWRSIVCGTSGKKVGCQQLDPCVKNAGCNYDSDNCVSDIVDHKRRCQDLDQCERDRLGSSFHCPTEDIDGPQGSMNVTWAV